MYNCSVSHETDPTVLLLKLVTHSCVWYKRFACLRVVSGEGANGNGITCWEEWQGTMA